MSVVKVRGTHDHAREYVSEAASQNQSHQSKSRKLE
jgi:hypothetical protein